MNAKKRSYDCPHCGARLLPWRSPDLTSWGGKVQYICFNDECPYFVRGWDRMHKETNQAMSYRLMYNPKNNCCTPIPVPSRNALKEGIVE